MAAPTLRLARLRNVKEEDKEFLAPVLSLVETPASPLRSAMVIVICAAVSSMIVWACLSSLDIFALAPGKVQPSGLSKIVQPLEPGRVSAIHVANGSQVTSGDVLAELDPTETKADRDASARNLQSAEAEIIRRQGAIAWADKRDATPPALLFPKSIGADIAEGEIRVLQADISQLIASIETANAQIRQKRAEYDKLENSLAARRQLLAVLKERVDMRDHLDGLGQGYRARVIDALQEYERERINLANEVGLIAENKAAIDMLEQKIRETVSTFVAEQNTQLLEAERKRSSLQEDVVKATSRAQRAVLRAPISGTVQELALTTVGQVVTTGQILLKIVPLEGPIEVEAQVENGDIGFVEEGQPAVVKVEAFPFTRYGTLSGRITKVSREAVGDSNMMAPTAAIAAAHGSTQSGAPGSQSQRLVFPVTIQLSQRAMNIEGKEIALQPGMTVTAEIKTGERRAIDYVLSPLREIVASSAHER